jgi:predicted RNA-binding protein YlqC (UPF0109 family)
VLCCCAVAASCLQHSIGINLTVQCPKSMVGRVIGKGGETIKNLQRKYHTSIQVGSQVRMTTLGPGVQGRCGVRAEQLLACAVVTG